MGRMLQVGPFSYSQTGLSPTGSEKEVRPTIEFYVESTAQRPGTSNLLTQILASLRFEPAPHEHRTRLSKSILIVVAEGPPQSPPSATPIARDERGELYSTSKGWEWHGPSYHLCARSADPSVRIVLHISSDTSVDQRRRTSAYAVRHAVTSILPYTGWVPLHGAALQASDGDGLLIVGPSGSGKSTLTAGLMLRGWACVSDDLVLLPLSPGEERMESPQRRGVTVSSMSTDLRLCPDMRERLHSDLVERSDAIARHASSIAYGAESKSGYAVPTQAATRPTIVLLPHITSEPRSHLESVSPTVGVRAVLEQMPPIPAVPPDIARRMLQTVGDLIRPCTCIRLHAGQDLYASPGDLDALLAPYRT